MLTASDLAFMRSFQTALMDDSIAVQRATLTADGYGGRDESWATVETVAGRLARVNERATEAATGGQVTSVTRWFATMPMGTTVNAGDRLLIKGRTWEILTVNNDEMWRTAVRCEVVAYGEESRFPQVDWVFNWGDVAQSQYVAVI
jgi:head-tail adaptor